MFALLIAFFFMSTAMAALIADADDDTTLYSCKITREVKTAKFDDLEFHEGDASPIPPHYLGLSYFNFQVDHFDGFIPATSGNQTAIAYGGSGEIMVPDSPPLTTFDLQSFSYACVAGVPQPECVISVIGWKNNGRKVSRTIVYPQLDSGHVQADFKMNSTVFGREWLGLTRVGFSITRKDTGGDMYGGLAIDDLKYAIKFGC